MVVVLVHIVCMEEIKLPVSKVNIVGSDYGLSPGRRQTTIWSNTGILLIGPPGTYFSEKLMKFIYFYPIKCMW